jgi:START domain
MRIWRALIVALLMISGNIPLKAQYSWVVKKEKDGIRVSTRTSDSSKFNDIKVELDLPGNIYQLDAILMDIEKYPQWAYATKSSTLIQKSGVNGLIYYSEIAAPWPASNRDFYAIFEVSLDSPARTLNISSTGLKDFRPPKENLVRVPRSKSGWTVTTLSDRMIHVCYILQADPGGSLPAWIMNIFSTKGPLETFENLKQKMILLNQ